MPAPGIVSRSSSNSTNAGRGRRTRGRTPPDLAQQSVVARCFWGPRPVQPPGAMSHWLPGQGPGPNLPGIVFLPINDLHRQELSMKLTLAITAETAPKGVKLSSVFDSVPA